MFSFYAEGIILEKKIGHQNFVFLNKFQLRARNIYKFGMKEFRQVNDYHSHF